MTPQGGNKFNLAELYQAYRKAKVEAFYERSHFNALEFVEYEQNLHDNLKSLLHKLNSRFPVWASDSASIGSYTYCPKSVDLPDRAVTQAMHFSTVNPIRDWDAMFRRNYRRRFNASFRLIIKPTVEFQVISALWILRVGHRYDDTLIDSCCYGNRLRRKLDGDINGESTGLFIPYFSNYQKWRENGLRAMRKVLGEDYNVVAVTMDISKFYHSVNPKFLLRKSYLDAIGIELSGPDKDFTKNFVDALLNWYGTTPDYVDRPEGAIPVGLSASKIISNVLLKEFDDAIIDHLSPVYYGRYVDDVFLVLRTDQSFSSGEDFIEWLSKKIPNLLRFKHNRKGKEGGLTVKLAYARDSKIVFTNKKQRIFFLRGSSGLDLITHIAEQIRRQSSEHRLLPDLPETGSEMASRSLLATPNASLEADSLRKADVLSVRRLEFSLLLRDVESYARDLYPAQWGRLRKEFYGLANRHIVTPQGFFDYSSYAHRIFGLMIACGDYDDANEFLTTFFNVTTLLRRTTSAGKIDKNKFKQCCNYYAGAFLQVAFQATTVSRFAFSKDFTGLIKKLKKISDNPMIDLSLRELKIISKKILLSDWGRRPYREYWFHDNNRELNQPLVPRGFTVRKVLRLGAIRRFRKSAKLNKFWWPALAFPTRPLSISEITLIAPNLLENSVYLEAAIFAIRGARVMNRNHDILGIQANENGLTQIHVPGSEDKKIRIAITSIETTDEQWVRAANSRPDLSRHRYKNFKRILNRILMERPHPHVVVFPELSIPKKWALSVAQKLAQNGISLIAGLEYHQEKPKILRSDAFLSLATSWPGYSAPVWIFQHKQRPSHGEKVSLPKVCGKSLYKPPNIELCRPIYKHGDFCFGVLICSDLTNIENRDHFQGNVDCLFVLEWNPDVRTFGTLVESAAHDVHAYIVQVNNRRYGDSRIRAPYRVNYERDVVRIKGGMSDYFVIAEIDYMALRRYQMHRNPPKDGEFKPWPIGFSMSDIRRI